MRLRIPRPAFGPVLLAILGFLTASELALGAFVYWRLRADLEADLGRRLVDVSRVLSLGVDAALVRQFREGDERLPAYALVREHLAAQALAAGVERAYVFDPDLRTLVDTGDKPPGSLRYGLLAHRAEVSAARKGSPAATRLYRAEDGQLRLSAFAAVRAGTPVLVGVDARADFFVALAALRGEMLLLGGASLAVAGAGALLLLGQVEGRLARLRRAMSRAARGDLSARSEVAGADEIGALGRDLDAVIASMVATRDLYGTVLGRLDVGILTTDEAGSITLANASAERLLAAGEAGLVGRSLAEVMSGEEPLAAFVQASSSSPGPLRAEIPLGGGPATGGRMVAASASPPAGADGGAGLVLSLLDVTDLRLLERRARANERLAALGGMAGGLLHEIRNPLASVTVYLDLLRSHVSGPGEAREVLDRAIGEGERLARFLEDFQIFAGLRPPRIERLRASEAFEGALSALPWPGSIALVRRHEEHAFVRADRRLLEHALRNLLSNALEALGPACGRVEIDSRRDGSHVLLGVTDDGPGIDPAEVERILDPLVTTKSKGSGLGLSIVQRVAALHGGAVEVVTRKGGGAAFRMRLPAGRESV